MVSKFKKTGSTADKHRCDRPRAIQTDRPTTSKRKRSTQLGISRRSLQRILNEDLKYHSYKIQLTHELQPTDYQSGSDFARTFLQLAENEDFMSNLMMTDEAHFHLNGDVYNQNCRFWRSEIHRKFQPAPALTHLFISN